MPITSLTRLDSRDQLGKVLNASGLLGSGVEVGVREGFFSQEILNQWEGRELILVDAWRHLPDYHDCANLSDEEFARMHERVRLRFAAISRVRILRALSIDAARFFPLHYFDWIYLDANHSYESTAINLYEWWPTLRPGGFFAGHDFYNAIPDENNKPIKIDEPTEESLKIWGVKPAVEEFAELVGKQVNTTVTNADPSWWFFK